MNDKKRSRRLTRTFFIARSMRKLLLLFGTVGHDVIDQTVINGILGT